MLVLIALYGIFVYPLRGSLIIRMAFTGKARDYVAQTYGEDMLVKRAVYNFKTNSYLCDVQSRTSEDTHFIVYQGKDGMLTDSFDFDVLQKENTIWRLSREMDQRIEREFLPLYPGPCVNAVLSFEQSALDGVSQEDRSRFVLDMPLELTNPPLPLELTLWVECNAPSWDVLAAAFRDAKTTVDALGWQVSTYSITLHTPVAGEKEKPISTATDYCAHQIPAERIKSDALAEEFLVSAEESQFVLD